MWHVSWVLLLSCAALPALPETDARYAQPSRPTYYPDYAVYHDVDRYNSEVQTLAALYPMCVTVDEGDAGHSRQGDKLYLVKVTDRSRAARADGSRKQRMLITFGEHAREFLPVESFFKLVHDTCKALAAGEEETVRHMGNVELLLIGLVNPDGRRHLEKTKDWCWRGMANMVDVNRNCDWEWGGPGSSGSVKSEEYRGTHPFSEPETRFVRDVAVKYSIDAYMSMHTGAQFIFVPYSDTKSKKSKRRHETTDSQLQLASRIWSATAGFFTGLGVVYELNDYTADGTIADYLAGALNIPISLTFELYGVPGDLPNCFEQFNPHSDKLEETLFAIHPAYKAAMDWLLETAPEREAYHARVYASSRWELVEGADSDGGDLYHVELTTNLTERARTLQQICDQVKTCNGFNSNGWLKSRVSPASQRRASKGTSLWIKRPILKFPSALSPLPVFSFSPSSSSAAAASSSRPSSSSLPPAPSVAALSAPASAPLVASGDRGGGVTDLAGQTDGGKEKEGVWGSAKVVVGGGDLEGASVEQTLMSAESQIGRMRERMREVQASLVGLLPQTT